MKPSEQLALDTYNANPSVWEDLWRDHIASDLAAKARGCISSIHPLVINSHFPKILEPQNCSQVDSSDVVAQKIAEQIASDGNFKSILTTSFENAPFDPPKGERLRKLLRNVVRGSINSLKASSILESVREKEIYPKLADQLSEELARIAATDSNTDERLLLNYAILIYHLRRWITPIATLGDYLTNLDQEIQGMRGRLISIQNRHPARTDSERFLLPRSDAPQGAIPQTLQQLSSLLAAVENESNEIAAENGFFHRLLPITNPVDPSLLNGAAHRTQAIAEAGRKLTYTQYEHTALIFMALASIEFLLRSFGPFDLRPDHSIDKVLNTHANLGESLQIKLRAILSADELNVRNRCLHGSFLEVEGRRDATIRSSGVLEEHGVATIDTSGDGSTPTSVYGLVVGTLQSLSDHLASTGSKPNTSWTDHFLLTADESLFAEKIKCDFLESRESAQGWHLQIKEYLSSAAPCLSTPIKMGIVSWVNCQRDPAPHIPAFHFLTILYEPLLRLTLHLYEQSILQISKSNQGNSPQFRVQYLMLDGNGLLSNENLDLLTSHINAPEKQNAKKILRLTAKVRDAFAHGAVMSINSDTMLVYGHVMIKAIQLVTEIGLAKLDNLRSSNAPH